MSAPLPETGYPIWGGVAETEEEAVERRGELFEIDEVGELTAEVGRRQEAAEEDCVYVAVGKNESSMDALSWTLRHCSAYTLVYLVHVFPEIRHVPSPLGMLPKSQVSQVQLEAYMAQERGKRNELLQKFIDACSASKVKVDTILIESDMIAKAILELIPVLSIKKLVVGTTKSNLRKMKSRKGTGIYDQVIQGRPSTCEINLVCEGKEVTDQISRWSSSPRTGSPKASSAAVMTPKGLQQQNDSFKCICFGNKF